jgi:hypothetical protein
MSIFWKGFGIFWILFLIWYLTGGPQRVAKGESSTSAIIDSSGVEEAPSSFYKTKEEISDLETQKKSEKSFPNELKTNTIDLSN